MKSSPSPFRVRALTTLVVALGFGVLVVSGAVLFVSPPGRVANWTQWEMLGLTKHGWGEIHVVFAAAFLIAALAHLAFNWRPMLQHLGARLAGRRGMRWEWVAAGLLGIGLFAGTRAHVPPFSTLLTWNEELRGGWEGNRDRAPVPHAELLTLNELAVQAGVASEEALRRLAVSGIAGISGEAQVQTIAEAAKVTPARIFELIQGREAATATRAPGDHRPGGPGAGGGPGRKTLTQFCVEEGLDLKVVQSRLGKRGLKASPDQTLREIAVQNGFDRPVELLEIIRRD
ncbi:MAG: DUF4405 domain-containing protein [Verrucomicrobiales bacterium]|nr:DUF4405 domain-containing protein [Verrucomicrobiales bacterium]